MKGYRRFAIGETYESRKTPGLFRTVKSRTYDDWQNDFAIVYVDSRNRQGLCWERSFERWALDTRTEAEKNMPGPRSGECCFCGRPLGAYATKYVHKDGRIACFWTGRYKPRSDGLPGCGEDEKRGDMDPPSADFQLYSDG